MNNTGFYDQNANAFYNDTVGTDMALIYEQFLPLLRPGATILDAGCGSGRDALAFLERGYEVDAFDGSAEMVRRSHELTGIPVKLMMFEDLPAASLQRQYDAIWCCASLLHIARDALPNILLALLDALKPKGIIYVSFKYGDTERIKDGRRFTDLTEDGLTQLLTAIGRSILLKSWVTTDQRPGRPDRWLNAIIQTV